MRRVKCEPLATWGWEHHDRCRENMAHIRHSMPDSGPGFRMKVLKNLTLLLMSFFFIHITPLTKWSITNHAPFALDR